MYSLNNYDAAFISNGLAVGGAERFFINVVNGLHDKGYKPLVILLTNENPLIHELHDEIAVMVITRKFRYDLSVSWRIKKILKTHNVNKVFCVETFPFILGKISFYFNKETTFYTSLHNSLPISFKQRLFDILYLSVFRKTDKAIFICKYQKYCFGKYYWFNPKNYHIIYNGIDTEKYTWPANHEIDSISWKKSLGLTKEDKTILMVGRISIEKGHKYAISALYHLHKIKGQNTHLVIVGSGDPILKSSLEKQVQELDLFNYVHFVGSFADVRPYLLGADLFTLTSFSETFSLAALEAMGCGLPVSLTNVGGAAEMIVNDSIGQLSEKNNPESIALSWKTILEGNYSKDKIAGYISNHFSLNKMISEYEQILELK